MRKEPKVIIVGASGQIGRPLHQAAAATYKALGTSTRGDQELVPLRLEQPHDFVRDYVAEGDTVFLTAAISAPDICSKQPALARAVNVEGASILIENCLSRRARMVFLSSDTVYGERPDAFDENTSANPAGDYAFMKHAVEERFAGHPFFKAMRLSYVFFKHDKLTDYLRKCAKSDEQAELFDPFERSVVYLQDVVRGLLALVSQWNQVSQGIINMGGPHLVSRVDFANCLKKHAFPSLNFVVSEPPASFFVSRPKSIHMMSPLFKSLLGREAKTLEEAAVEEFSSRSQRGN
jgi:nucleoside-diphosphate-sugar epimerase